MLRTTLAVAFAALVLLPGACSANSANQIQVSWSNAEDKEFKKKQLTCGEGETKECRGATVGGTFAGTCTCKLDAKAAAEAAYKDGCRVAHGLGADSSEDVSTWWNNDAASGTQCQPKSCGYSRDSPILHGEPLSLTTDGRGYKTIRCSDVSKIPSYQKGGHGGDVSKMALPDGLTMLDFNIKSSDQPKEGCEGLRGDVSKMVLPDSLEWLKLNGVTGVTGDVSRMKLGWWPTSALRFDLRDTGMSGDVSQIVLPDSLEFLNLDGTGTTGDVSEILQEMSLPASMKDLYLTGTGVTGDVSEMFLASVVRLSLHGTGVTGDVSQMSLPSSMEKLWLSDTQVTGDVSKMDLKKLVPNLKVFFLSGTQVDGVDDLKARYSGIQFNA